MPGHLQRYQVTGAVRGAIVWQCAACREVCSEQRSPVISTSAGFQMPFAMNGAPDVRRQMLQWQNDDTDGGALTDTLTAPQKH